MGRGDGNRNIAGATRYVCIQFFAFLVISGVGIAVMYFADNCCHLMAVGIAYLIMMSALIIVILADQFDREVRKRLRGKS
jgi:hypothetical protein